MDKKRNPFAIAVITRLGGPTKTAAYFGIRLPSVSAWAHKGIPKARLRHLEETHPQLLADARAQLKKQAPVSLIAASDDVQPPVGSLDDPEG
ncbi:hypothetical protein [Paraburkholderia phenazinium]|uniref:Uncharacterized protein n=1 Tax=Paraburkholderia phenazinium TaxID=60549 RepID=A0A1N6KP64_9BURK|nr:hypothetical protein [Paraburkholderia phenazinium]SIO58323.1 hypothetical protein SAMN05444165_4102 [Paraburkholderia phenazinium]